MAEIRINATGGVKLYDADDSHYAQIVAGTITSNVNAITLGHDVVSIVDNLALTSDSAVLKFGADNDTTLTHTDGTGLTLNSTNKLCFNDASQFIQGSSNAILALGATDEIDLTATAVDLNGTLDVSGNSQFSGTITVGVDDTGKDVKLFGATSGSFLLWDESADALLLTDSTPIQIGDAQDLTLYHDGTNSYITNAVGALKIATETSGIALTIGHTTSETTIADNLTVTGTATITGGQIVFPGTQAASAGANTLDDYEEGTWTIGITFGGGATSVTYGSRYGAYTKIGNRMILTGRLILTDKGSSTGAAVITGLPVAASSTGGASVSAGLYHIDFANQWKLNLDQSSSTISLFEMTEAGAETTITDSEFDDDAQIFVSVSYMV